MSITFSLSAFYISMYNNKSASLILLSETVVAKEVMVSTYKKFVNEKLITPIENLMIEEKIKLWEECKSSGVDKSKIVDAAKILHTLKFINENS